MVLTNVLGAAYTAACRDPGGDRDQGPPARHRQRRGGRRALPGSLYSCTKWAVTAMGEAVRQDLNDMACA